MDIRLSKQKNKDVHKAQSNPECSLFRINLFSQTVVYRKRSSSKKKSLSNQSRPKSGIKLNKQKYSVERIEIKLPPSPMTQTTASNMKTKQTQIKEKIMNKRATQVPKYQPPQSARTHVNNPGNPPCHGSWGIPKYSQSNHQPKQQKLIYKPPQIRLHQVEKIKNQIQRHKRVPTQPKIQINFSYKQHQRLPTQSFNWNNSKLNSTRISRNQQQNWGISTMYPTPTLSVTRAVQSFNAPSQYSSRILKSNQKYNLLNPIQSLEEARQAKTVISGDMSYIHSQQDLGLNQSMLKQSAVIGNNVNQDGFWN